LKGIDAANERRNPMAQQIADRRDIDFVLHEQFCAEDLSKSETYAEFNRKMYDMVIKEARKLAIDEILPTYMEGDREGVRVEDGQVKVPDCFHRPYELFLEGEWQCLSADLEWGGQGMPHTLRTAAFEYLSGANYNLCNYALFGTAVGNMIMEHGSDLQKEMFVRKLYSGEWSGTMLLTEPQAGSDVGSITTTATKNDDGTYSLTGEKIFITVGDHDLVDNIIHPVLARIEGEPEGTKGISIFLVPKIWVKEDGSLGEPNDIKCSSLEEKMGLHAMSTCTMTLGAKNLCRGLLMGEKNKGMRVMFTMMNEARLGVGTQAFMYASAAYMHALNYARERVQGRDILAGNKPDAGSVRIIEHPDVRRMLLDMKAYVEGMRSMIYFTSGCFDRLHIAASEDEKVALQGITDLITPIVKAYSSDRGFEVCVQAMQVLGGYGYTREYPVEQLTRDCKITSIYEGTNGIQSMDLLGRKIVANNGASMKSLAKDIQSIVQQAAASEKLRPMADAVGQSLEKLTTVVGHLVNMMLSPHIKTAFAFSYPLLEVFGDLVMAWMLLWRAVTAQQKLNGKPKKKDVVFYEGQIKTAAHFIFTKLPITNGKMEAILIGDDAVVAMAEEAFGSR
jgi:alkylation response protein AidB-like acyl-CoA dehydrogenase